MLLSSKCVTLLGLALCIGSATATIETDVLFCDSPKVLDHFEWPPDPCVLLGGVEEDKCFLWPNPLAKKGGSWKVSVFLLERCAICPT